jgi:hypothetical protein
MGEYMTCFKKAYLLYDFRNEPYMISRQVASGTLKLQVIVLVILVHLKYMQQNCPKCMPKKKET